MQHLRCTRIAVRVERVVAREGEREWAAQTGPGMRGEDRQQAFGVRKGSREIAATEGDAGQPGQWLGGLRNAAKLLVGRQRFGVGRRRFFPALGTLVRPPKHNKHVGGVVLLTCRPYGCQGLLRRSNTRISVAPLLAVSRRRRPEAGRKVASPAAIGAAGTPIAWQHAAAASALRTLCAPSMPSATATVAPSSVISKPSGRDPGAARTAHDGSVPKVSVRRPPASARQIGACASSPG